MVGEELKNKQVILKQYAGKVLKEKDMEVRSTEIALQLEEGRNDVFVKNLYLSADPYMRHRMNDFHGSYLPPFTPGQPLNGYGVSKVLSSNNPNFKEGDYVSSWTNWEEYSIIPGGERLKIVDPSIAPLSYHLGCLGMPGFTAYAGLHGILKPKQGETLFVSAASGAVGQMVGQLAKLAGVYVVGSAGSEDKIDLLKNKLAFNAAFNYKEETDLIAALKRYCPNGIDMYFENVGGKMLDAALENMNIFGRIAVCGLISTYNKDESVGVFNLYKLISRRLTMQGFLQHDYTHLQPQFLELMSGYLKNNQVVYIEDYAEGLDNAPAAFIRMMKGEKIGKQIIRVAKI